MLFLLSLTAYVYSPPPFQLKRKKDAWRRSYFGVNVNTKYCPNDVLL